MKDAEGLTVTVEQVTPGKPTVRTTIANPTDTPQTFCDYHTPFEGIRNDIFVVRDAAGNELDYRGIMAKRAPPTADNHLTVDPGKTRTAEVDLSTAYDLTAGVYRVSYRGTGISGLPDSPPTEVSIE